MCYLTFCSKERERIDNGKRFSLIRNVVSELSCVSQKIYPCKKIILYFGNETPVLDIYLIPGRRLPQVGKKMNFWLFCAYNVHNQIL